MSQALDLIKGLDEPRSELNFQLNRAVILVDGGYLRNAGSLIDEIQSKISSLPANDIYRGYFYLLTGYAAIRSRDVVRAMIDLRSARELFEPAFGRGAIPIRMARIRCLEQRLSYLTSDISAETLAFNECRDWTLKSGPGRVGDFIEGMYLDRKKLIKLGSQTVPLNDPVLADLSLPPNVQERFQLTQAVLAAAMASAGDRGQFDFTIVKLASFGE